MAGGGGREEKRREEEGTWDRGNGERRVQSYGTYLCPCILTWGRSEPVVMIAVVLCSGPTCRCRCDCDRAPLAIPSVCITHHICCCTGLRFTPRQPEKATVRTVVTASIHPTRPLLLYVHLPHFLSAFLSFSLCLYVTLCTALTIRRFLSLLLHPRLLVPIRPRYFHTLRRHALSLVIPTLPMASD